MADRRRNRQLAVEGIPERDHRLIGVELFASGGPLRDGIAESPFPQGEDRGARPEQRRRRVRGHAAASLPCRAPVASTSVIVSSCDRLRHRARPRSGPSPGVGLAAVAVLYEAQTREPAESQELTRWRCSTPTTRSGPREGRAARRGRCRGVGPASKDAGHGVGRRAGYGTDGRRGPAAEGRRHAAHRSAHGRGDRRVRLTAAAVRFAGVTVRSTGVALSRGGLGSISGALPGCSLAGSGPGGLSGSVGGGPSRSRRVVTRRAWLRGSIVLGCSRGRETIRRCLA